jgi:signal transduction histidine kinase
MTVNTTCSAGFGSSIQAARRELAERWLNRLMEIMPVEARSVFPTDLLLDHIPALIEEIGKYLVDPAAEDIAANTIVIEKARELGQLRHQQRASLHQVLREYDLLGEILDQFIAEQANVFPEPALFECLDASSRLNRAVRVLMQITAGMFISEYTNTLTDQAKRLDRFNRAVGHELRNVLGTLQFGAQLLDGESMLDDERRAHLIGTVRRNADRAVKIIRSFERLPQSGIVADKPTEQSVEFAELTQEVARQLQEMADARGVELRIRSELPMLYLDTGALELILINLVSNAIKYADPAKPTKFVEVAGRSYDGHYEIEVNDNGIGIPADSLGRIFERFTRAHPHLDEDLGVNGSGLGLAIVEECVKSLAGEIEVQSEEHAGTKFVIHIPKKLPPLKTV